MNFTKINNGVLEKLIWAWLTGTEFSMVLLIIRKTIGWNKESDQISTKQFCEAIWCSKRIIEKSKINLQLMNVIALVKKGAQNWTPSEWSFNKDIESWKVVNKSALVNKNAVVHKKVQPSAQKGKCLVNKSAHTKDTLTKETIQKKTISKDIVTDVEDKKIQKDINRKKIDWLLIALKQKVWCTDFKELWKDQRRIAWLHVRWLDKYGKEEYLRRLQWILDEPFKQKNSSSLHFLYKEIKGYIDPKEVEHIIIP